MIQPTKRLIFREWLPDDWLRFKPIANDPRVVRYVVHGAVPTDEQIRAHIEAARKRYLDEGFCLWPLVCKANQELIGFCGLDHLWDGPDIEIGYWLAHAYWDNGLATEAAQAVLDYGFGKLGLQRIVAVAHPENRASLRVLQKLGMTFERMAVHQGVEHVLYSKSGILSRREHESAATAVCWHWRTDDMLTILRDNDGALVDTEGLYFQDTRDVLRSVGVPLTTDQFKEISQRHGKSCFPRRAGGGCGMIEWGQNLSDVATHAGPAVDPLGYRMLTVPGLQCGRSQSSNCKRSIGIGPFRICRRCCR